MKSLALILLLTGSFFLVGGCSTPGYTAQERQNQITRNWDYESKQLTEDWDYFWLLRPSSRLTTWNVR